MPSHIVFSRLGVPYTADALAEAFSSVTDEDPVAMRALIRRASEQLMLTGRPGAWAEFNPHRFFDEIAIANRHQRIEMAVRLLGFFHWLWLVGLLELGATCLVSDEIVRAAPQAPLVDDLHAMLGGDRADWGGAAQRPN